MKDIESISNKDKLLQLEKEGKYLFHGSPLGTIKYLEPRQARHVPDISKPTETILDGSPLYQLHLMQNLLFLERL